MASLGSGEMEKTNKTGSGFAGTEAGTTDSSSKSSEPSGGCLLGAVCFSWSVEVPTGPFVGLVARCSGLLLFPHDPPPKKSLR